MIEARLRHQYAHAPTPGPKTEQPLATGPSADTPKPAASPSGYAAEMTHCHMVWWGQVWWGQTLAGMIVFEVKYACLAD